VEAPCAAVVSLRSLCSDSQPPSVSLQATTLSRSCAGDWLAAHRAAVHDRNPKEMQQLLRNPQLLPLHLAPLAHCRLPTPLSIPTSLLPQMVFQLSDDVMQGLRIFATLLGALGLVAAICTACQRTLEPVQLDSLHSRSPLDPALHYTL